MTDRLSSRTVWALAALAFALRMLAAALTNMPAEDGVNYLWMAERLAEGDDAAALSEVFPPLLPLLIVPLLWLGLPAFFAGQVLAAITGALTVVATIRLVERIQPDLALHAGLFMLVSHLAVRYGARVYSEPLFLLLSALSLYFATGKRYAIAGLIAGTAFWARPEAALLPVAFAILDLRRAWIALIPFGLLVLALGAYRDSAGLGFVIEAKTALHNDRLWGDGFSLLPFLKHFFTNLSQIPVLWFEAFGLIGALALLGMWKALPLFPPSRPSIRSLRPLSLLLILGIIVICQFLPRRRFLMSWFVVLLPFAVLGLQALAPRLQKPVLYLTLLITLAMSLKLPDSDKINERYIGEYLGKQLAPEDQIVSDMTRVLYFAGLRPNAPRHFTAEELAASAQNPRTRFVVLGARRPTAAPVTAALRTQFKPLHLPPQQQAWCEARGILILTPH